MSLTKKDPTLRVAANDPHVVSLGGGRLSTAVTIHYIPIGDTTIGSSSECSILLNGSGVQLIHCTIYRSEENEVTLVPERDARTLIDGNLITQETNLSQGAMITIGNSNYLRFNNPAEAERMRSAMGSNERISMPQIDFTQPNKSNNGGGGGGGGGGDVHEYVDIDTFYETKINPLAKQQFSMSMDEKRTTTKENLKTILNNKSGYDNVPGPIDINGLQCPKVFTADLVTVNMPAKDVLGQKYASFAKNLAENHRNDKNVSGNTVRNNQMFSPNHQNNGRTLSATSSNFIQNPSNSQSNGTPVKAVGSSSMNGGGVAAEYLAKVNNTASSMGPNRTPSNQFNNQQNHHSNVPAYDRYPKPGTYGGLQIFPMNGINTEMNNGGSASASPAHTLKNKSFENSPLSRRRNVGNLSTFENERLEDMLKICTEYSDRQNQSNNTSSNSITSSPIVQNRIKTNGSLPREKKTPFYHDVSSVQQHHQQQQQQQQQQHQSPLFNGNNNNASNTVKSSFSSGYENVRFIGPNRVEINGQTSSPSPASASSHQSNSTIGSPKNGYENVVLGKYVPQSPRTKIRTTCMSPKKDHSFSSSIFGPPPIVFPKPNLKNHPTKVNLNNPKENEYEQLIKTFEEKLKREMEAIEESSRHQSSALSALKPNSTLNSDGQSPVKRTNININNLTLNLHQSSSPQSSPKPAKKPAPAPRNLSKTSSEINSTLQRMGIQQPQQRQQPEKQSEQQQQQTQFSQQFVSAIKIQENDETDVDQLKDARKKLLNRIQQVKNEISDLQKQEDEALRELDLESALVSAEVHSVGDSVGELELKLQALQTKIHRMETQRNATRVMQENQQAKLKKSIEMKQDQVKRLKALLKADPSDECYKEEMHKVNDSLENDRKVFEDLEFQYLEEESDWHAFCEEMHAEEKALKQQIEEKRAELQHLEIANQSNSGTVDIKGLKSKLMSLHMELKENQSEIKNVEQRICEITGQLRISSSEDDDEQTETPSPLNQSNLGSGVMSQSLFGSAEILCPKRTNENLMSKSVNENLFYNNKIELPQAQGATSTPKQKKLHIVDIDDSTDFCFDGPTSSPKSGEDPLMRLKYNVNSKNAEEIEQNDRMKFNLSLGSDDFEVNPLEKRVPSQDDIDRICKVANEAPLSKTKGASTKIFDSIKEIERNRQLLLAQQGHHVIEHERQKMNDLKKKSHDEARAQYLQKLTSGLDSSSPTSPKFEGEELQATHEKLLEPLHGTAAISDENQQQNENQQNKIIIDQQQNDSSQQRNSQPEYQSAYYLQQQQQQQQQLQQQLLRRSPRPSPSPRDSPRNTQRPLSETNSEFSCDLLSSSPHQSNNNSSNSNNKNNNTSNFSDSLHQSNFELSRNSCSTPQRNSVERNDDGNTKRSSVNSNETASGVSGGGGSSTTTDRKRALPKHQRPLTRYLPIFSPDLNLRQHIESAGHQITLCPHVFVDAYSCRGYLHKLGATFHGWSRRWFVLDRQRNALIYYSDKSERKPRGGAYFSTIDEVYLDHLNTSKSGRPHCTFIVKTKKRSYHLQAASDAAARIWIDAIITGAQGNLDY